MKYLFLIIISLLYSFHISGNEKNTYYFDHYNIDNGLSQNTVNCIFQDSKGFMWFGTKNGLNRFDGYTFKVYSRSEDSHSIGNSSITTITEDSEKKLWIGTDKGIYIYDPMIDSFSKFNKPLPSGAPISYNIHRILFHHNTIWIRTGFTFFVYDKDRGYIHNSILTQLKEITTKTPTDFISDDNSLWMSIPNCGLIKYANNELEIVYTNPKLIPTKLYQKGNNIYIGTSNMGILVYDKFTDDVVSLKLSDTKEQPYIRTITTVNDDLWIGTENGIYIIDNNNKSINIRHKENDPYSISNDAIYAILQDKDKGVWVGSYFGGIDYSPKHQLDFEKFYPNSQKNPISGYRVREMCQDSSGNLWIATEDAGLNFYNPAKRTFKHYTPNNKDIRLSHYNIQCLHLMGDYLWIGYFQKGIDVLNIRTGKIKHYETKTNPSLTNNDIFSISSDNSGKIWIGTSTGVFNFEPTKEIFIKNEDIGTFYISDIHQDSEGYIWFATYNIGAIKHNPRTNSYKKYTYSQNDSTSICYSRITTIFEDSSHNLWFGSEDGGMCRLDKTTERFKRITTQNGLPNNVVHKILEDRYHTLWISTNNGLARYNPETGIINTYNTTNGLLSKQFNYNSGLATNDGRLYFGNIRGLVAFSPEKIADKQEKSNVILTKFQLFNQDVTVGEPNSILSESITYTDHIILDHTKSSFNIEFSNLDFASKEYRQYAYMLSGVNKNWIHTNSHIASYNNVQPGKYTFRVKVRNINGDWNTHETQLHIIITPPWWKTNLAYIIYAFIILSGIYFAIQSYRKKMQQRMQRQQHEQEQKKQEEIYQAKIDFFTNIAHEIRTPLTLIKVPLDEILKKDSQKNGIAESLTIIKRNTDRLFALVNQLLDFRKIESKVLKLHMESIDINVLIKETLERFKPAMIQNGLHVNTEFPNNPIIATIDKEAFTKVISNLFTNATKFAQSYVQISLTGDKHHFEIRVNNDGERILPELNKKIFEAFYQIHRNEETSHHGSGLGLSLAASLVALHKGHIFVDDKAEDTSFVVQIPIGNADSMPRIPEKEEESFNNTFDFSQPASDSGYTILIVEDNKELQQFLAKTLSPKYTTLTANNGAEALEIINHEKINLVISDIIMPVMDGIELCNNITSDISTCHIPVILLTAKTNLESKIKALKHGAAAYIEKPFSMEYLDAQISNLIDSHKKLLKNFEQNPFVNSSELARNKTDEKFLNKITDVILQNIDKENFNVDDLAFEVNMSRTSLHRKLKESYGMTPGDFIRVVRLKKAAELIQNGEYRINEICILVGFHSQSYFTKSFHKQFGVLPKDFMKSQKTKD